VSKIYFAVELFDNRPLDLPDHPAAAHQKYMRGLALGWTGNIDLDISPTPPVFFTGSQNIPKRRPRFFNHSRFRYALVSKLIKIIES